MLVTAIPALKDNYNYIFELKGLVGVVDPSGDAAVSKWLDENEKSLDLILNTHHHLDHVGGNLALKERYNCDIYGPYNETIPGRTHEVRPEQELEIAGVQVKVLDVAAHTLGHIAYHFYQDKELFCGDSLFSMGCGRLFEGTPSDLERSLKTIAGLDPQTRIHCAHEYTLDNAHFALEVEPSNMRLQLRIQEIAQLREQDLSTASFILADELETNPFLRPNSPAIRKFLKISEQAPNVEVLGALRRLKDNF